MTLWNQPLKNYENELQHKKNEKEIQINTHSLIKNNQPKTETPTSNYKMGGASIKIQLISWVFIKPFNLGYVPIINSGLKKCIYEKNF